MNVSFSDIDEYLEELKESSGDTVVRSTIEEDEINDGVKDITLVSGFCEGGIVCEARIPCGEDLVGGKGEGTGKANDLMNSIKGACQRMNIEHRGGKWQLM